MLGGSGRGASSRIVMFRFCSGLILCLLATAGFAQDRTHFNYILYCQGCHTADGVGAENAVPRLKDQVGYFLQVEGGREYLVQVPGSATSALNDKDLTAVLNWMVQEFAGESLSSNARPYTEKEVAMLRKTPLKELVKHREALVLSIASELKKVIK